MELRDESSRLLILDFAFHPLWHQQDAYGSQQVDKAGNSTNGTEVIVEINDQHLNNERGEGSDSGAYERLCRYYMHG